MKEEGKYSIEKMHQLKHGRRSGKTVDAIVDVIGKLMVTGKTIPFVIEEMRWADHITPMFYDICKNHFNEKPIINKMYEYKIEGYEGRIILIPYNDYREKIRGLEIEPTFDLK